MGLYKNNFSRFWFAWKFGLSQAISMGSGKQTVFRLLCNGLQQSLCEHLPGMCIFASGTFCQLYSSFILF